MAIAPWNISDDFHKAVAKLESEGYRYAAQEDLPENRRFECGAEAFMINGDGRVVSVHQATGEVQEVTPVRPKP